VSDRTIAINAFGNQLVGRIISDRELGGTTLITIELEGTTSSVEVDEADFYWMNDFAKDYPLKRTKAGDIAPTLRVIDLAHDSTSIEPYQQEEVTDDLMQANSVCSDQRIASKFPWKDELVWDSVGSQKLMIDIDVPAYLIPSSTRGHSHLYIDKDMDKEEWLALLIALRNAGIIEHGYAGASIQRGYTALRLPWVSKHSGTDAMVG
jgi:hypothetical protein